MPVERIGVFSDIDSLSDALNHELKIVSAGSIKYEEEGAVIYMISRGTKFETVLSLSKLKSLEYRIFRKLRAKLRNFWNKYLEAQEWTTKMQKEYLSSFKKFINECNELVGNSPLPKPLKYYKAFADIAFNSLLENFELYDKLERYYADFLEDITYSMKEDYRVYTSQIFNKVDSNKYNRQLSNLLD